MNTFPKVYFAGALYASLGRQALEFKAVRASHRVQPYIYRDLHQALRMYRMMAHHSALYCCDDGYTAHRVQRSDHLEERFQPKFLVLPTELARLLRTSAA